MNSKRAGWFFLMLFRLSHFSSVSKNLRILCLQVSSSNVPMKLNRNLENTSRFVCSFRCRLYVCFWLSKKLRIANQQKNVCCDKFVSLNSKHFFQAQVFFLNTLRVVYLISCIYLFLCNDFVVICWERKGIICHWLLLFIW